MNALPVPALLFWAMLLALFALAVAAGGLEDPCTAISDPTERRSCEAALYYP